MSEVTEKIRSKGAWDVTVRPASFVADRVTYSQLEDLVTKSVVRMRGWPVPYIDLREPFLRGEDWVGQDIDAQVVLHYEAWRFFQSGQFNHLRAISADWREGSDMSPTPIPEGADAVIEIWEILFYLTEVFELAARLALSPAGAEDMVVSARLDGLRNRALVVGQPGRLPFMQPPVATVPSLEQSVTLPRGALIAEVREQAVRLSQEFFLRFGWEAPFDQLLAHQRELTDGS